MLRLTCYYVRNACTENVIREERRTAPDAERVHVDGCQTRDVASSGVAHVNGSNSHRTLLFRVHTKIATFRSRATSCMGCLADAGRGLSTTSKKEYPSKGGNVQGSVQQQNRIPVLHVENQDVRRGRCSPILDIVDIKFEVFR